MEVQGADQWAFTLRRLQQETRRNAIDAVTYAGVKIAISGRKIAKPGDKRRKVEKNPDFKRMVRERKKLARAYGLKWADFGGKPIYPHYIISLPQLGPPIRMGTFNPQTDPRRAIDNRGLAQKMWNILYGQLASLKGTANESMQNGAAAIRRSIQGSVTRYSVFLNLTVRLNYLEKAYPGIGANALQNGQASLLNELDNRMRRTLAKYGQG